MYMTAGILVERISGDSWENFTRENLINPLEMNSTNFATIESRRTTDFAKPYKIVNGKIALTEFRDIQAVGPAGAINSNVIDMSKWVIMNLNYGKFNGKKIVDEEMIYEAQTPVITIPGPPSKEVSYRTYALGWTIAQYRGHLRVEHGGNIDGFSADVCLFPADSVGLVILTNMDNSVLPSVVRNIIADKMFDLSYIDWSQRLIDSAPKDDETPEQEENKDPNQKENTEPSHALIDYTGKFENNAYGTMKIELKGENLLIDFHTFKIPLGHYHYDYFKSLNKDMPPMLVNFGTNERGDVNKVSVQLEQGVKDIEFTRIPDYMSSDLSFDKYVGEYDMQGMIVKVSIKNNVLKLLVPGQPEYDLLFKKENNFDIKDLKAYSVTFNFDGDKVSEVQFNQPNGTFKAKKKIIF
jgi:hypothetical protein